MITISEGKGKGKISSVYIYRAKHLMAYRRLMRVEVLLPNISKCKSRTGLCVRASMMNINVAIQ